MLYLARGSRMALHNLPNQSAVLQADIAAGTLVFTAERSSTFEVLADAAKIRPVADSKTIAQVTVIDPKTLYVYARQGSLVRV